MWTMFPIVVVVVIIFFFASRAIHIVCVSRGNACVIVQVLSDFMRFSFFCVCSLHLACVSTVLQSESNAKNRTDSLCFFSFSRYNVHRIHNELMNKIDKVALNKHWNQLECDDVWAIVWNCVCVCVCVCLRGSEPIFIVIAARAAGTHSFALFVIICPVNLIVPMCIVCTMDTKKKHQSMHLFSYMHF